MAVTTLTIGARQYPVGQTSGSRSLPGSQPYSVLALSVDCTGWVSPLTTRVEVSIDWSFDGGVTWENFGSLVQNAPPPWATRHGFTSTMTGTFQESAPRDPTHMRGTVNVTGQSVNLGPITLNAS